MNRHAALIIIGTLIIIGIYWFFVRPYQIKADCHEYAYGTPNLGNTTEWVKATNYYYEACLHRNRL